MSFLSELKRRNVVRVGVAYLVVGWLLLQVVGTVAPGLGWPGWVMSFFIVLIAVGFPIVLLLSWAFEMTPEGVKKTGAGEEAASGPRNRGQTLNYVIIAALVLALGYFIYERQAPGALPEGGITLAVLPFADLSQAGDQEYLGDGMAEEILNVLAPLDGLTVTSRTSAFAFKGRSLSLPEIAATLGVRYVVEGSVRKQDERVRITAQLIDVASDSHLWSETYDRDMHDIFAIQDEIANRISAALSESLNLALPVVERETPDWDIAAYELYLRGRQQVVLRGLENTIRGATLLHAALAIEPEFTDAWAELAAAEDLTGFALAVADPQSAQVADHYAAALDAGARAVALDPGNSLGLAVQGDVRRNQGRLIEGRILLERSLATDQPVANGFLWLGILQAQTGNMDQALDTLNRGLTLHPKAPNIHRWIGILLGNRREFAAAQPHNRIAADMGILGSEGRWLRYQVYLGRADISALTDPEVPGNMLSLSDIRREMQLLAIRGMSDPAARQALLAREADLLQGDMFSVWWIIETGPDEMVNRLLSGHFAEGLIGGRMVRNIFLWGPGQSEFRRTEAFRNIIHESGIDKYWAVYGFPPGCQPLGAEEFECE